MEENYKLDKDRDLPKVPSIKLPYWLKVQTTCYRTINILSAVRYITPPPLPRPGKQSATGLKHLVAIGALYRIFGEKWLMFLILVVWV